MLHSSCIFDTLTSISGSHPSMVSHNHIHLMASSNPQIVRCVKYTYSLGSKSPEGRGYNNVGLGWMTSFIPSLPYHWDTVKKAFGVYYLHGQYWSVYLWIRRLLNDVRSDLLSFLLTDSSVPV